MNLHVMASKHSLSDIGPEKLGTPSTTQLATVLELYILTKQHHVVITASNAVGAADRLETALQRIT